VTEAGLMEGISIKTLSISSVWPVPELASKIFSIIALFLDNQCGFA
jgi:hypothetical protein